MYSWLSHSICSILCFQEDLAWFHPKSIAHQSSSESADCMRVRSLPYCFLSYFIASFIPCLFNFICCFILVSFSSFQSALHSHNKIQYIKVQRYLCKWKSIRLSFQHHSLLLTLDILNTFYLNANNFSFLPGKYNDLLGFLPPAFL